MKGLGDDSMQIDVTNDEKEKKDSMNRTAEASIEKKILEMERSRDYTNIKMEDYSNDAVDNVELPVRPPVSAGFLVSFMVDARGGAMRGCRHSGVRVIIPPRKAPMPMRVTCRYLKKDKLVHPPPLNEGEALASRILELGPAKAQFLGPVIIEVPHFASLRGKEREIVILRSDNGEKWTEHSLEATEEAVQEVLQESFDGEDTAPLEDLNTNRITRILTTDFPQYFAIITRIRQELHAIGPDGGLVNSSVVPQVQAMFPQGALTKKIKVGLQAQPIPPELTAKLLGNRVAVSPIVTVEPRRRKFHKPITLTIPVPVAAGKGMINQYSGDTPTLRLLCSITGGTTRAQWEDVTGSTPLTFLNDCVSFTTTVSARFWLMDCRHVAEATKMATTLYKEAIHVPFMAKFVVFSKRHEQLEARVRVFCMTDDKEEKTLENQEHFHEIAKSRDVEVLEGKTHHLEFFGNLHPVTKSGDQLSHKFHAFRENRLPFTVRVKDPNNEASGRVSFFREPKQNKGEVQQTPLCNLNLSLPSDLSPEASYTDKDLLAIQAKYSFLREAGYGKFDTIHRADLRVSDISNLLGKDWIKVARELGVEEQDINLIMTEYPDNVGQQAMVMLRLWLNTEGNHATGNALEKALQRCDRQDIVNKCMINMAEVTDDEEMTLAQSQLQHADQSQQLHHADDGVEEVGFNDFKAGLTELGPSKNSTLKRDYSMDVAHEDFEITEETSRLENISEERMTAHTVTEHRLEETSRMAETTMMVEESSSRVVEESSRMVEEISLTTKSERLEEEATAVYEREEQKYVAEEKALTASFTEQEEKLTATTTTTTTSRMEEEEEERRIEEEIVVEEQQQQVEKKMSLLSSSKQMFEGSTVEESMSRQEQVVTESTATFQEERKVVVEEETFVAERTNGSAYTEMARTEDTRREEEEEEVVKEVVTGTETSLAEAGDLVDTEKKEVVDEAKGLKGLKESLEDSFEIVKPDSPTEGPSDTTHLVQAQHSSSFSEEEEEEVMESEPESPKSPSPKVSPGSKSPSPAQKSSASSSSDEADEQRHSSSDSEEDEDDLKKATEQELLDEMIVKDVPEASTDPVKKFEETQTTSGSSTIDCIEEDAEDSQLECKDPLNDVKPPFVEPTSATTTSSTNLSNFPFNIDSNFPISHDSLSSEMPSKEEEQDKSPTLSGLAAPDSKDSLEVQMYSVCEDISDTMSGREESVEDIKLRDDSCDLGEEEQLDSVSGKELEIAEIKHEFEVIEECEFDEARKIACEVKEEAVQEIHMETRDQNLVSNTEVKQQMSEVMNIFEKIETESNDKKDEVDDVKVERQTVSTVVEQIEKQVEIQDECVVKTAYKTTSFESSDYSETSDKESSFKKISTTIQEQVEIKDKCDVKTFYKTTSEESSDYSELSDAKDMKRHPMPIQESTDESETAERKSEDEATVTGCLKVVIVEAADLVNQDMVGKSDPYAILSYQGKDYRSETVNESLTPVWNFEVDLDIEDINTDITIKIFDDDYGRDNFEGGLILAVDSLVKSKESRSWYNLTDCKSGRVLVSTLFSQGVVVQSDEAKTDANVEVVTKERQRVSSTSSSASSEHDDGVKTETRTEVGQVAHHSSDSSLSTRQESTVKKLHTQDTVDENDSLSSDAQKERKDATSGGGEDSSSSSDDSSDTEEEGKRGGGGGGGGGAASSSDYDSSNRATRPPTLGGKRPDSFVSDTSSDYDSASNPGSRRPQSFVLDDEYDVITEEEAAESTKHDTKHEYTSSESESEGPAVVGKKKSTALPPIQGDQEGDDEDGVTTDIDGISSQPEPLRSSMTSTPDLHAEQSSVSLDVAKSTVINSNTLEEIDPLANDTEKGIGSLEEHPTTTSGVGSTDSKNSQDLRNQEGEMTSSEPITISCVELPPPDNNPSSPLTVSSPNMSSHPPPPTPHDMSKVFEGISTSTVTRRLSEIKKDGHSVFISVTSSEAKIEGEVKDGQDMDEEFVMIRRESTLSSGSESSMVQRIERGSTSSEKSVEEKLRHDVSFRNSFEGSEITSPNNVQIEPFAKPSAEDIDEMMSTNEHKPIPTKKQLIKINSSDLLHRQIREDMIEQVMCEEDDSMMMESALMVQKEYISETVFEETNSTSVLEENFEESLMKIEDKFNNSAIDLGMVQRSVSIKESDLSDFDGVLPEKLESTGSVQTAEEAVLDEPNWEVVEADSQSREDLRKRSMTPEQALEIASDIVQQVQFEAVKRVEEMVKSNNLPKPLPDSKFTPETKEKVQVYLKTLEDNEEYDEVAADLITKVVSKKEENMKRRVVGHDLSVDVTDDEKSEAMMSELRNELMRSSVTDEDLVTDMTCELLEEKNIDDIRKHLEDAAEGFQNYCRVSTDFRFQTSFRAHFVKDQTEDILDVTGTKKQEQITHPTSTDEGSKESFNSKGQSFDSQSYEGSEHLCESEDIWAKESRNLKTKDLIVMREKKSDNESNSSGSKHNFRKSGTDHEGYSSSGGETFFSAEPTTSGASRPSSSDVEAMLSAHSETRSTSEQTEYVTAQDHSSADTSFFTANSTLSSRESVKSSESSGHLGSVEVSECSETLVESSLEYDARPDGSDTPSTFRNLEDVCYDEIDQLSVNPYEEHSSVEEKKMVSSEISRSEFSSISTLQKKETGDVRDDVDGCLISKEKNEEDSEREYLIQEEKESLVSKFSESRETLSSSVLTLSSISEATVVGTDSKAHSSVLSNQLSQSTNFEFQRTSNSDSLFTSVVTLTESTSSTSSGAAVHSTSKTDSQVPSLEDLKKDESPVQDQLFPEPRMRNIEGAHSVQVSIPQDLSIDFGSDYESRPNSELKQVQDEPRPLSAEKMSRSQSQEEKTSSFKSRSYSVEDTVSDNLRVFEPFARPVSPMPDNMKSTASSRHCSESEDRKLRVSHSSPADSRRRMQSSESIEAEIAFSKHFTQVLDESEFEPSDGVKDDMNEESHLAGLDLTPESAGTSESMETSQGQDYFIEQENLEFRRVSPRPQYDLEDPDDLLVGSPPMVSRPLGVKYWPPIDNLDQDLDACGPMDKRNITRSESDDNSESRLDIDNDIIEKEVEQGKKWLENQFEEQPDEFGNFNPYGQPLDQILEEEEDRYSYSSEDIKELAKFKESLSSTPDFDAIVNKRHQVSNKSEHDDVSMGSLTEFERLEREVALGSGSGSRGSLGSNDSLEVYSNGNGKPANLTVKVISKTGDDVSVSSFNSLKSFEMMEKACAEAEAIEKKAKYQEEVLSEIEEGHESQVSESESGETISEFGEKEDEEFEERMFEIDSIIKQAQANVEQFQSEDKPKEEISLAEIMGTRPESRTESIGSSDSLDGNMPEEESHQTVSALAATGIAQPLPGIPTRVTLSHTSRTTSVASILSVTSVTSAASTLTQFDPDSIHERDISDVFEENLDLMQASIDSLEQRDNMVMVNSTDSLEANTPRTLDKMTLSTDSIDGARNTDPMTVSVDSLEEKDENAERDQNTSQGVDGACSMLFASTDSIESGSTNTRATASMLSSMTSQGSETLVADDEFEHDDEDSRSARRFLINQGNLQLDDSDDSTTYSHSSPQLQTRQFTREPTDTGSKTVLQLRPKESVYASSEETVETEEIDEKGNIVIKKVVQKRIVMDDRMTARLTTTTSSKADDCVSDLSSSEKKDDSCEETIEEVDQLGNRRVYVVKRSIESVKPPQATILDVVVQERREQIGLSPVSDTGIFKPTLTNQPAATTAAAGLHHVEQMTRIFDAPPSTPSPPTSPPASRSESKQ